MIYPVCQPFCLANFHKDVVPALTTVRDGLPTLNQRFRTGQQFSLDFLSQ